MSSRISGSGGVYCPLPVVEQLEQRRHLSHSGHSVAAFATPPVMRGHFVKNKVVAGVNHSTAIAKPSDVVLGRAAKPAGGGTGSISALTPAQVRKFYDANAVSFGGITGDGSGQTIAIVDAYDQPNLLNSNDPQFDQSDLHLFDVQFGLPDPPSFLKLSQTPGGALPATQESNWSIEESLDVEWAHALAPGANIVLVEANSSSATDLLQTAVVTAKTIPGVSVISMSFTFGENAIETSIDPVFTSPGSQNVTFVAATGDAGSGSTGYPALSPNVVAVGGTMVGTNSNGDYLSETTWNDYHGATGGGPSAIEARPSYQANTGIAGSTRTAPDVSFDGSPSSGVYVIDSAIPNTGTNYYKVGGTSLGAPCWAALVAIANQGRQLEGLAALDGPTGTLPRLYNLPQSDFHDITTGSNDYFSPGYSAGPGYDMTTGRGTPRAASLVADLAGGATVSGTVTDQTTGTPMAGQHLYLDLDDTGVFGVSDPITTTDANGFYQFSDLAGNQTGTVRLQAWAGGVVTASAPVNTAYHLTDTVDLSFVPIPQSAGNYTLSMDATGVQARLSSGDFAQVIPSGTGSTINFSLTNAGDSLTVDASHGNPIPAGGMSVSGVDGIGNSLRLIGSPNADVTTVGSNSIRFDGVRINYSNLDAIDLTPGSGTTNLSVLTGSATVTAGPAGTGIAARVFSTICVGSSANLSIAAPLTHADRTLVMTSSLNLSKGAVFDLGGNDMIVIGGAGPTGSLSAVNALVGSGSNFGRWNGAGIISSAAKVDGTHTTSVGVAGGSVTAGYFDGHVTTATDVVLKYTRTGDANLDGRVDGSDYSLIDAAYGSKSTCWQNGDFDGDGVVDGSDYSLLDNAFNNQGSQL